MIKNNYVCDGKYMTTYTTNISLDFRWQGESKKAPRDANFR